MGFAESPRRTRLGAALAAAAVQLGLAAAVIWGLTARWAARDPDAPTLVTITPSRQPSPLPEPKPEDQGAAAPPSRKSAALPVAAPSPSVALIQPRPAATTAAEGEEASAGAATVAGPGSGGGGSGSGSGSGEGGGGSGSGLASAPVRTAGVLSDRDYPRAASGATGTVAIAFRVRLDGRVDRCTIIASSGVAILDRLTCELVERRFRYRPGRGANGQPVETVLRTSFTWGTRQRG